MILPVAPAPAASPLSTAYLAPGLLAENGPMSAAPSSAPVLGLPSEGSPFLGAPTFPLIPVVAPAPAPGFLVLPGGELLPAGTPEQPFAPEGLPPLFPTGAAVPVPANSPITAPAPAFTPDAQDSPFLAPSNAQPEQAPTISPAEALSEANAPGAHV